MICPNGTRLTGPQEMQDGYPGLVVDGVKRQTNTGRDSRLQPQKITGEDSWYVTSILFIKVAGRSCELLGEFLQGSFFITVPHDAMEGEISRSYLLPLIVPNSMPAQ